MDHFPSLSHAFSYPFPTDTCPLYLSLPALAFIETGCLTVLLPFRSSSRRFSNSPLLYLRPEDIKVPSGELPPLLDVGLLNFDFNRLSLVLIVSRQFRFSFYNHPWYPLIIMSRHACCSLTEIFLLHVTSLFSGSLLTVLVSLWDHLCQFCHNHLVSFASGGDISRISSFRASFMFRSLTPVRFNSVLDAYADHSLSFNKR
jgi:hypothetical protein